MTPREAYSGLNLDASHLWIFSYLFYYHVPSDKRKKLEPTAKKGILTSYSETSKAYRVYMTALKRVVMCRVVQFEEVQALSKLRDEPEHIGDQLSQE